MVGEIQIDLDFIALMVNEIIVKSTKQFCTFNHQYCEIRMGFDTNDPIVYHFCLNYVALSAQIRGNENETR